jgi:hypothetical protein
MTSMPGQNCAIDEPLCESGILSGVDIAPEIIQGFPDPFPPILAPR